MKALRDVSEVRAPALLAQPISGKRFRKGGGALVRALARLVFDLIDMGSRRVESVSI